MSMTIYKVAPAPGTWTPLTIVKWDAVKNDLTGDFEYEDMVQGHVVTRRVSRDDVALSPEAAVRNFLDEKARNITKIECEMAAARALLKDGL